MHERGASVSESGKTDSVAVARAADEGGIEMCLGKLFRSGVFRGIAFFSGLVFVALAVFCSLSWNEILERAVERELALSASSKSFGLWEKNPTPFFVDFYFFNWTNPADLKLAGRKPRFREAGPYRFREEVRKTDVEWNENKTVTYRKLRRWYFEPAGSNGSLDDVITSLNVVALTAARSTRYWNRMARIPLSVALSSTQNVDASKRVRELLFEGFADPLIDVASRIPGLSPRVPFDRFGWFYERNDSSEFDGVFNVETGTGGLGAFGELKFWNFGNRTRFYEGRCGEVKGSAGDFWPPQASKSDRITLFSPDMCRYVHFIYGAEEDVGGVRGRRYDSGPGLFDNGTKDPENACFCGGVCLPSGVVNVSSCRFGAPAFVSYPHFHMADPFYSASVEGLKPEPRKHDTYIVLEQKWGIPLEVAIRLQINILMEPEPGIRMFDGVPTIFFPMLWFEQKVTVPEHLKREVEFLSRLPELGFVVSAAFYAVGFSCLVVYVVAGCRSREKGNGRRTAFESTSAKETSRADRKRPAQESSSVRPPFFTFCEKLYFE